MIQLSLIGIGSGNPEHMTLAAVRTLNAADLVLIPRKGEGKAELADLRRLICAKVLTNAATRIVEFDLPKRDAAGVDYEAVVEDWHDRIAAVWSREIAAHLGVTGRVAFLIWGDPSLFDSSLRIAGRLRPTPGIEVVPGVTAIQALCAAHAIPLNEISEPVLITTGRQLREKGWPADAKTVAVMLDGDTAFKTLDPAGLNIWWGAYLGMDHEVLASGALADVAQSIVAMRGEARAKHGWIMDTYILKRQQTR
ncbi:MAG: precorrin-6A synthase (deacetylating) [Hyphomicrobium sp.]